MTQTVSHVQLPCKSFCKRLASDAENFKQACRDQVFGQLVTYAKDSQEFILDPCLPKNEYVLNRNGLLEWLWRKRFNYFQKCHLYNEYHLARHLLNHDFTTNDCRNFKDSDRRVLNDALHWLLQKCFGRVSALRRFRIFLRKTDQGYKMYQFWLDTEQLVLQIKNRASNPMRLFNKIKNRYFSGAGNLIFPQHLLDAAWRQMPKSLQRGSGDNDKRVYDFTFAVYMQKLCKIRLCTYWVPRYVVSVTINPEDAMEESYYSLALQYVRFRMAASTMNFEPEATTTSGGGSKLESGLFPDIDVSSPEGGTERLMTAGSSRDSSTASQGKRKVKVSFAEHAPPGESSEDEEELEDWEKEAMKERQKRRKAKAGRKSRGRKRSPRGDRSSSDKPSTPPSGEEDGGGVEDPTLGSGSSSDSVGSSESWEGMQDKVVKSNNEKQFQFKSRHRRRSLATRKQRFEQLLQNATDRRSSVSSEASVKAKAKGRRKSGQAIVDNVIDDIELGGTWETTAVQKPDKESSSRRDSTASAMETMGGKSLLKAALRLSGTASDDNEGFINSAPNSLWDVEVADDQASKSSRRNSEASDLREELGGSLLLSRLSETRRSSRKGSTESFISTATALVVKKRRPIVKNKPKKTKVTTLTFSLSGEGPTENVKNQTQKEDKPKKKDKNDKLKKTQQAKKIRKTIHKSIDKMSNLVVLTEKTFSMLEDHEYRSQADNARVVLALQCDNSAARPFRQFLINTDNEEMVDYLSFWQHVECLRWDYNFGSMTFLRFISGLKAIVSNFLLSTSPFRIESPPRLRTAIVSAVASADVTEMPWQLRKLQMEVMEDLKYCYEAFAQQDVHSFITAAAFQTNNYVPNSNSLQWHLPGQQPTSLSVVVNKRIPDAAPLAPRLPGREGLQPTALFDEEQIRKEMKQRMLRSHKLAIEGHLPTERIPVPVAELSDDSDDSDVNGRMMSPTPPKAIFLRPTVDMKELASRSLRQYPDKNRRQVNQMRLKKAERNPQAASFYRPIKRGAHYLKRPLTTPANFNEVLREQVHLEFFKRYLKAYRADTPFLFWIAVEALRTQENVKERQNKARVIIKRYFHNPKMEAVKMLQCTADIIREIPYLDVVTTSMLYSAQTVVAMMLEERWYRKYADTFTDSIFTSCMQEEVGTANVKSNKLKRGHLRRAWTIFNDFIKRAAMFMRYMQDPRFIEMFNDFLKRAIEQDDVVRPVDDSLQSDVVANRSNNMPLIDLSRPVGDAEKDRKSLKQRIINGQLVTFDLLPNDLNFWREIQCYKTMSDCLSAKESIGGYSPADADLLKWKAKLIVNCYLDSSIAPPVRVNVPIEVAEITCESLQNGLIDRGLFHEATIYVFPVLLTFWKRFCDEHYKYFPVLSKKYKRIYGLKMTPAIAEAMKRQNEAKEQQAIARELSKQKNARLTTADFPDYLHIDPRKFKKRRGSPHGDEMCTRLTFSVSKGVTLVEPVRRKFNMMKNASADVLKNLAGSLPQMANKRTGVRTPGSRGGPRVAQRRTGLIDTNLLEQFSKLAGGR